MDATTLRQKYGRPKYFENAIYYSTSHYCPVFDDEEEGTPFVIGMKVNGKGPTNIIFHPVWLDDLAEFFDLRAIKLIERDLPNTLAHVRFQELFDDD